MGTSVFTYRLAYPVHDGPAPRLVIATTESGIDKARSLDPTARWVGPGAVILDGTSGHAYSDWLDYFRDTLKYGAESCLVRAFKAAHREVSGESLGTAAGGSGETFTLAKKFIDQAISGRDDTLVIKVAEVAQPTADYTFSLNNTAPQIATNAGFDAGAVTADYFYFHQARVTQAGPPQLLRRDKGLAAQGVHLVPVEIREVKPGGHLA